MSQSVAKSLDSKTLADIRTTVFIERQSTLDLSAEPYSLSELTGRLAGLKEEMRKEIEGLPDEAFEKQPDDVDGSDVWSAGQIISHLSEVQARSEAFWSEVLGVEEGEVPITLHELSGRRVLSREEALLGLEAISQVQQRQFGDLNEETDYTRSATHQAFGKTNLKGALLITCIHEDDHTEQLRELAEVYGRG